MKRNIMKYVILFFTMLLSSLSITATTYTYSSQNSSAPRDWTTPSHWSPSYPGTSINSGDSVILTYGNLYVDQGITINGVLKIASYNTLIVDNNYNLTIGSGGILINDWWVYLTQTSQMNIYGTFIASSPTGSGTYINDTSQIIIHPNGQFNLMDTLRVSPMANLNINGTLTNDGNIYNQGTINGNGSIVTSSSTSNGTITGPGTVAPGLSPGELKTDFDYILSNSGSLDIEIGGTAPGNDYDVLGGTGNKDLGGTLNVILYNNYVPTAGDTYTIVKGGAITDTFTTVSYPSLPGTLEWELEYRTTDVVLHVNAANSIEQINALSKIEIYPNPTRGILRIEGLDEKEYAYKVYTIAGHQIQSGIIMENRLEINVQNSQILFIELIDGGNKKVSKAISYLR